MPDKTYERVTTKQTLNKVREEKMPFGWSINPYRGCAHGCSFCYARAFQSFIGRTADDEFQHHIIVKANAAEALEAQLSKLARRWKGDLDAVRHHVGLVAIGTATDPYQPVERKAMITRQCLHVLANYGIPVTITTRSPLILRDLDLLTKMNVSSINISMNSLRREIVRKLEPATPFPMKRIETVQQIRDRGLAAGVFIAPILPYLTDSLEDMEALLMTARRHNASFAMTSLLRLSPDVKVWFFQSLQKHYPQLIAKYAELYRSAYADRSYAEPLMKQIRALTAKYGLSNALPEEERIRPNPAATQRQQPEQLSFQFH